MAAAELKRCPHEQIHRTMPIEIDASWRLYDPVYALLLALGIVATIASVIYQFARRWKQSKREHNRRVLSLVAEVLVSVGVIGLVTFAARAKIDHEIRRTDRAEEELRRQLNAAIIDYPS